MMQQLFNEKFNQKNLRKTYATSMPVLTLVIADVCSFGDSEHLYRGTENKYYIGKSRQPG